ncbi:MAG: hypothetical protein HY650_03500 [Acidobacteria bacterium]|nr:hypothetical protein [Acidobacteriota bacterium]
MKKKLLAFPILILLSSFLVPSLTMAAKPGTERSETASAAPLASKDQTLNLVKIVGPGLLLADNAVCQAEFTSQGFRYVPKTTDALQTQHDFNYRLKSVHTAHHAYVTESDGELSQPAVEGNEVSYRHAMEITEIYQARNGGIEQLFILNRNLQPVGEEFRITGEVITGLRPESSKMRTRDGITFYAGQTPILEYGAAKVIDATGREQGAELELIGNRLSIVISSAWLRDAAYPVTVDPFIGPLISVADSSTNCAFPAVAADSINSRYLVVWEQGAGPDSEIMGRLIDASGAAAACQPTGFNISSNSGKADRLPDVAFDASSNRFLVVWEEHGTGAESTLRGRFVGAEGNCSALTPASSSFGITGATGVIERGASVAVGRVAGGNNRYLVAYLRGTPGTALVDVVGQQLNQDGTTCGAATLVGTTSGWDFRNQPGVGFGEPQYAAYFSVVYRSSDNSLKLGRIAPTCGSSLLTTLAIAKVVVDGPPETEGAATNVRPSAVYNPRGRRWLINWVDYHDRLTAMLNWQELGTISDAKQSEFRTLLGASRFVKGITPGNSSQTRDVVVAVSTATTSTTGFNLLVFHLHYDVEFFSTTIVGPLSITTSNNAYPVIVAHPTDNSYVVFWQRDLMNGLSEIVGRIYLP